MLPPTCCEARPAPNRCLQRRSRCCCINAEDAAATFGEPVVDLLQSTTHTYTAYPPKLLLRRSAAHRIEELPQRELLKSKGRHRQSFNFLLRSVPNQTGVKSSIPKLIGWTEKNLPRKIHLSLNRLHFGDTVVLTECTSEILLHCGVPELVKEKIVVVADYFPELKLAMAHLIAAIFTISSNLSKNSSFQVNHKNPPPTHKVGQINP